MNDADKDTNEEFNTTPPEETVEQPAQEVTPEVTENPNPAPVTSTYAEHPVTPLTSTSPETPTQQFSPTTSPKKSHRGLVFTILGLAIFLLAALGVIAYLMLSQPKEDEEKSANTSTTTQQEASGLNAQELVEKARTAISDQLADPSFTLTENTGTPVYKPDSVEYAVSDTKLGHGFTLSGPYSSDTSVSEDAIDTVLTESLEKNVQANGTDYQNKDVTCSVRSGGGSVSLRCADIKVYSQIVDDLKPFTTAYLASPEGKANTATTLTFGEVKIVKKSDGYSNANVQIYDADSATGGIYGLYYEKDGTWTYWKGAQGSFECSDYNTYDLQKAFEGDECYDNYTVFGSPSNTKSTVKVTL